MSCVICNEDKQVGSTPLNLFEGSVSALKDPSTQSISGDLSIFFVIRNMLGMSPEFCEYLIFQNGSPSSWGLGICSMCRRIVQEAQYVSERIRNLVDEYHELAKKVRGVALVSFEGDNKRKTNKNIRMQERTGITEEIRARFYENHTKVKTERVEHVAPKIDGQQNSKLISRNTNTRPVGKQKRSLPIIQDFMEEESDGNHDDINDTFMDNDDDNDDDFPDPVAGKAPIEFEFEDAEQMGTSYSHIMRCEPTEDENYPMVNGKIPCPQDCGKEFDSVFQAKAHVQRVHEGEVQRPYFCAICSRQFSRPCSLNDHYKSKHNEALSVPCPGNCGVHFESEFLANVHMRRIHDGDKNPYHCEFCPRKFARPSIFKQHLALKHKTKAGLKRAKRLEKVKPAKPIPEVEKPTENVSLPMWDGEDAIKLELPEEIHFEHADDEPMWNPCDNESNFNDDDEKNDGIVQNIPLEGYSLSTIGNQANATSKETDNPDKPSGDSFTVKLETTVTGKLRCPDCGRAFASLSLVKAHQKRYHQGIQNPYDCPTCNGAFPRPSVLKLHMKEMHGVSQEENVKQSLKNKQVGSNIGKKKFACPRCGRRFSNSLRVNAHVKRYHENVMFPYACKLCAMTFEWPSRLLGHMKQVHPESKELAEENLTRNVDMILIKDVKTISEPDDSNSDNTNSEKQYADVNISRTSRKRVSVKKTLKENSDSDVDSEEPDNDASPEWTPRKSESGDKRITIRKRKSVKGPRSYRRMHSSKFDHKCECGRSFIDQMGLDTHILRIHQGDKNPFPCDICEKRYPRFVRLLLHKRRCHPTAFSILPPELENEKEETAESSNPTDETGNNGETEESLNTGEKKIPETKVNALYSVEDLELLEKIDESGPRIPCDECHYSCKSSIQLTGHINIKHRGIVKGFECPRCHIQMQSYDRMLEHCLSHINRSAPLRCTESGCERMFSSVLSRDVHVRATHKGIKQAYQCTKCPSGFVQAVSFYAHMRLEHKCPPGEEELIVKRLKYNAKLPLVFKCQKCQLRFPSRLSMEAHLRKAHPTNGPFLQYPCRECHLKFTSKPARKQHMVLTHPREKKVICDQCGKAFLHQASLQIHIRFVHLKVPKEVRKFICELCGNEYTQAKILEYHQQQVHHDQMKIDPLTCKECGKILNNERSLLNHMTHVHLKKGFRYPCKICPRGFMESHQLDNHIRIYHTKERPFKCNQPGCSKAFTTKAYWKNHLVTHREVKPFNCKECSKSFSDSSTYRRHMEVHGSTVHECDICGKQFKVRHAFRLHMKNHSKAPGTGRRSRKRRSKARKENDTEDEEASSSSQEGEHPQLEQNLGQQAIDYSGCNDDPQMPTLTAQHNFDYQNNPGPSTIPGPSSAFQSLDTPNNSRTHDEEQNTFPTLISASMFY